MIGSVEFIIAIPISMGFFVMCLAATFTIIFAISAIIGDENILGHAIYIFVRHWFLIIFTGLVLSYVLTLMAIYQAMH